MQNDLENSVRGIADKIVVALRDASELEVKTYVTEVSLDGAETPARLVARTLISIDGDHDMTVPMRVGASGALERDDSLLELHLRNVTAAMKYRTNLLNTLFGLLKGKGR